MKAEFQGGGNNMTLIKGKRYEWYVNNYENKKKDGLFTGEYDNANGNAIMLTRNGEKWSVDIKDLQKI